MKLDTDMIKISLVHVIVFNEIRKNKNLSNFEVAIITSYILHKYDLI